MKEFHKDGKMNFVDDNNVFVGYDYGQYCCECAGYLYSKEVPKNTIESIKLTEKELECFNFVKSFFQKDNTLLMGKETYGMGNGGTATFKLKKGSEVIYLTLYNCHNGYYGHDFEMKINDKVAKDGCL